ncbi:hypothetical protein [Microbulbifer sp. SAOS-129_SWC]|uniref:hypothetical protein n=1 Tax=Microbulbifer sp. SAOS-129_SWC TaxID=3145235 RepID=UPI00321760D3
MVIKPNYKNYSLRELREALDSIDREKWPDRVKEIEAILKEPASLSKLKAKERKQRKLESDSNIELQLVVVGTVFLVMALILSVSGDLVGRFGVIHIDSPLIKWVVVAGLTYLGYKTISK